MQSNTKWLGFLSSFCHLICLYSWILETPTVLSWWFDCERNCLLMLIVNGFALWPIHKSRKCQMLVNTSGRFDWHTWFWSSISAHNEILTTDEHAEAMFYWHNSAIWSIAKIWLINLSAAIAQKIISQTETQNRKNIDNCSKLKSP